MTDRLATLYADKRKAEMTERLKREVEAMRESDVVDLRPYFTPTEIEKLRETW